MTVGKTNTLKNHPLNNIEDVEEFYAAIDLNRNKEIWFDIYNDGHTISTGRYKLN